MDLGAIQREAFLAKARRDPTFYCCYPHPNFPTISITGDSCSLSCKHCSRHYLRSMVPCTTPDALFSTCLDLASNGARGVLLSGGYNSDGYISFEPFLDAIERVKRETGLFISAHTGLVPSWLARELGHAGVDLADFDLVGSDETIKLVLGVDRTAEDYRSSLHALNRHVPHVVPHICIGLHAGEVKGEREALQIAAEIEPKELVLLVLVPTIGTEFERVFGPSPAVVGELVADARLRFPMAMLALGCMRPRDARRDEIELQALRSGIDRIEIPGERTIEAARAMGLNVKYLHSCCAVPEELLGKWNAHG